MAKMVDHARRVLAHQQAQTEGGEADEAELPEALPADPAFLAPLASSYTIRKRVTVPVLPFPVGATYVFRILEAVHVQGGRREIRPRPGMPDRVAKGRSPRPDRDEGAGDGACPRIPRRLVCRRMVSGDEAAGSRGQAVCRLQHHGD